jgi:TRAP-type C4-dicarboxylate transport system permease small subunit
VVQNLHDHWVATLFPTFLVYGAGLVTGVAIIVIAVANLFRLAVLKLPVSELVRIRDDEGGAVVDVN